MTAYNDGKMLIQRFLFPEVEEVNSFLVACLAAREAVLIDAGGIHSDLSSIIREYSLDLKYLFITHSHYDHISGVDNLIKTVPEIAFINRDRRYKLNNNISSTVPFSLGMLKGAYYFAPGHTDDMQVLYLNGHLFTGDLIFAGSLGGTKDYQHYAQQKNHVLYLLETFPDETIIHPGHGPDSTVALERAYNPFIAV